MATTTIFFETLRTHFFLLDRHESLAIRSLLTKAEGPLARAFVVNISTVPAVAGAAGRSIDRSRSPVLALDLGTTTGWAMQLAGGRIESGTVSFRPSRYDGGGMRYLRFRGWLDCMATDVAGIGVVHYEEVRRHLSTDAAHVHGGLLATLTSWCEERSIAYQGVPVGTIKRFIAGKGNADKQAVLSAVRARGFQPADDNEADAIAILLWAIETHGGVR